MDCVGLQSPSGREDGSLVAGPYTEHALTSCGAATSQHDVIGHGRAVTSPDAGGNGLVACHGGDVDVQWQVSTGQLLKPVVLCCRRVSSILRSLARLFLNQTCTRRHAQAAISNSRGGSQGKHEAPPSQRSGPLNEIFVECNWASWNEKLAIIPWFCLHS